MNKSDMILEFIDGTLDGNAEQELFDDLAGHPELRTELRQYVMIGDAVRTDREAYAPPSDVERKLFGGLGLIPLAGAGGGAAGAAAGGAAAGGTAAGIFSLAALKSGLLPLLIGFLLGSLLVGSGVWYLMDSNQKGEDDVMVSVQQGSTEVTAKDEKGSSSREVIISEPASGSLKGERAGGSALNSSSAIGRTDHDRYNSTGRSLSRTTSTATGNPDASRSDLTATTNPSVTTTVSREQTNASEERRSQESSSMQSNAQNGRMLMQDKALSNSVEIRPTSVPVVDEGKLLPRNSRSDGDGFKTSRSDVPDQFLHEGANRNEKGRSITVEMRKGLVVTPFADNNARQVQTQFMSDFFQEEFAAGLYTSESDWYYGLEGGRERFAQSFFYNQEDSLFIEQKPNITWFGLAFGRNMEVLNLPLFMQGTLGASTYFTGPMARGRLGIDLAGLAGLPESFSLPFSLEASSLVYTINDQYLISGNWGISLGGSYSFGF